MWTLLLNKIKHIYRVTYSPLQLEPTFWEFPYKMTQGAKVENHLKFMLNPSIFSQMLVLMWEADHWVLGPQFSLVFEVQAFKFESTQKVSFSKEKWISKIWQIESPDPLEILQPKLMEKFFTLVQAIEIKLVDFP